MEYAHVKVRIQAADSGKYSAWLMVPETMHWSRTPIDTKIMADTNPQEINQDSRQSKGPGRGMNFQDSSVIGRATIIFLFTGDQDHPFYQDETENHLHIAWLRYSISSSCVTRVPAANFIKEASKMWVWVEFNQRELEALLFFAQLFTQL